MIRTKRRAMVSISYFDFDFGDDDLIAANVLANLARATITDQCRAVELKVRYLPDEDKEEEQDDQTTD